jgi:hypothetical protein
MLKPIDDFIQSHLEGTAPSCAGSVPMTQNWTDAQRLTGGKKLVEVADESLSESAAVAPSFLPPIAVVGNNIVSLQKPTEFQPPTPAVAEAEHHQSMALARAETARRRQQLGC